MIIFFDNNKIYKKRKEKGNSTMRAKSVIKKICKQNFKAYNVLDEILQNKTECLLIMMLL